MKFLQNPRIQNLFGGTPLEFMGVNAVSRLQMMLLRAHKDKDTLKLIRKVRKERKSLVTAQEAFIVHSLGKAAAKREGQMAEVGVFQGSTARLLCEVKGDRVLHLFDTFEGLPEPTEVDQRIHKPNLYGCSLESVSTYLKGWPNVQYHKGYFPDSAVGLEDLRFSFAHFDVDLYESTLGCLRFFYPRMIPGGVMLSHDYSVLSGVKAAFTEFLADKPEGLIELPTTQCMVIKI